MSSPSEPQVPFGIRDGWPEVLPGTVVSAREAGITLGSVLLSDAEWIAMNRAVVLTLRIDEHPVSDGWNTWHPDGSQSQVRFEIPTSPVEVPPAALNGGRVFADWVENTHGSLGRLLVWDQNLSWWLLNEPDLEVALTCSPSGLVGDTVPEGFSGSATEVDEDKPFAWLPELTPQDRERIAYLFQRYQLH